MTADGSQLPLALSAFMTALRLISAVQTLWSVFQKLPSSWAPIMSTSEAGGTSDI